MHRAALLSLSYLLSGAWSFILLLISYHFSSATSGGILDKAIEAEENQHGDFLRLVMSMFSGLLLFEILPLWTVLRGDN